MKTISNNKRKIFLGLLSLTAVFVCSYMVFISKTVSNVVARGDIEQKISSISGKVSDLEFQYLSMRNNVNLSFAKERGYVEVSRNDFITSNSQNVSLR